MRIHVDAPQARRVPTSRLNCCVTGAKKKWRAILLPLLLFAGIWGVWFGWYRLTTEAVLHDRRLPDGSRTAGYVRRQPDGSYKPHGLWVEWYPNGRKRSETEYDNGIKHGWSVQWSKDGSSSERTKWANGQQEGTAVRTPTSMPAGPVGG